MSPEALLPVAFIIGYLLGSIPFGLILTRLAGTPDLPLAPDTDSADGFSYTNLTYRN